MKVHEVHPTVDSGILLAGAQFIDAYSIMIGNAALDARRAAKKMLARGPRSIAGADPQSGPCFPPVRPLRGIPPPAAFRTTH